MNKLFSNIKGDAFGGITAGIVALPLALAFGVSSGLGPSAGLYGAIFISFFAALFALSQTFFAPFFTFSHADLSPFSRLAEPRWIAAAVAYLRDIDLMSERRRKRNEDGPNPKAPRKGDQGDGKGGGKAT